MNDLRRFSVLLLAALLAGCGRDLQRSGTARFEETACVAPLPYGQSAGNVRCGVVAVPEDRRRPGRKIQLAVVVLRATGEHHAADPIVYLGGGPGDAVLDNDMQLFTAEFAAPLQKRRDIVFFDQRGAGHSQPALRCPDFHDVFTAALARPQTAAEDEATVIEAMRACREQLVEQGIDLAAYTSAASAADLRDLMTALGYRSWNVYGVSYGTRLALTALRDTGAPVRSVVLDSTLPLQVSFPVDFAADFQRALQTLFADCAADADCSTAFPDLESGLFAAVHQLDEAPAVIRPLDPLTGKRVTVAVTGERMLLGFQQAMYRADLIPLLPAAISAAGHGDLSQLSAAAGGLTALPALAWGMYYSVECGEEAAFFDTDAAVADALRGVRPEIAAMGLAYMTDLTREVCRFWGSPPLPAAEHQPLASDVPVLVLVGELDPITPPAYGELAARTLSRSYFFELRGIGHGVLAAQSPETTRPRCAMQLLSSFVDDPLHRPNDGCLAGLAAWRHE